MAEQKQEIKLSKIIFSKKIRQNQIIPKSFTNKNPPRKGFQTKNK